jgi:hypothetical protein
MYWEPNGTLLSLLNHSMEYGAHGRIVESLKKGEFQPSDILATMGIPNFLAGGVMAKGVQVYGEMLFQLLRKVLAPGLVGWLGGDLNLVYLIEQYITGEYMLGDGRVDKSLPSPSALEAELAVALSVTPGGPE